MTRRRTSSPDKPPAYKPPNLARRWRPRNRSGPECLYTFRGSTCHKRGAHYCEPRANRVMTFFGTLLVHTSGPFARHAFVPAAWQEYEILRPLFGEVEYAQQWQRYVRRYRVAYIVMGRKNGKSQLVAGITLYLLLGDDEEAAEIYGAAKDTKQAGKVFEPALRMVQLSPTLAKRLRHIKNSRRLVDEKTASYYEVITADALGELGHNPHGFVLDEVLSQPDDSLWNALRTGAGARTQPLMCCITTETNDPMSFGADMINEAERVADDPARAPHIFAFVRKTPKDADPWDERTWHLANPALGTFLSIEALRQEAIEARNDPTKENSFRQYRLNQRVSQATRFITLDAWDACQGEIAPNPDWLLPKLIGQRGVVGLDLSSKFDLTSWCVLFDSGWVWWRYWLPEDTLVELDPLLGGKLSVWAKAGWITVTDGDVIDYEQVYADIRTDAQQFRLDCCSYDKWNGEPVRQRIEADTKLEMIETATTYERMTTPMTELARLIKAKEIMTGGNPVARWHADSLEAKTPRDDPERIRPVKPARGRHAKRIDGMATLIYAIDARARGPRKKPSIYETRGLSSVG